MYVLAFERHQFLEFTEFTVNRFHDFKGEQALALCSKLPHFDIRNLTLEQIKTFYCIAEKHWGEKHWGNSVIQTIWMRKVWQMLNNGKWMLKIKGENFGNLA